MEKKETAIYNKFFVFTTMFQKSSASVGFRKLIYPKPQQRKQISRANDGEFHDNDGEFRDECIDSD